MEIAVVGGMLAVGYFLNENKKNNTLKANKKSQNLRIKEHFNTSAPTSAPTSGPTNNSGTDILRELARMVMQNNSDNTTQAPTTQAPTTQAPTTKYPLPKYRDLVKDTKLLEKAENVMCAGGDRRTEKASCPYPSSTDTLWQGNVDKGYVTLLSGEKIKKGEFQHANMTPHFGSKLTQNVDVDKPHSRLNLFTGSSKCVRPKKECKPFFKPQKNLGGIGAEHFRDINVNMEDRYICSKNKKCELPFKQIKVGAGLNQGFTSEPSGGFGQNNTRDFVMPKTVDELRTLNNPKISYESRVQHPKGITKRGKHGKVYKNRPDTFYKNSPDRYFKTTGAIIREKNRPTNIIKKTNRTTLNKGNVGIAGPTKTSREQKRPEHHTETKRQQFKNDPIRNVKKTFTDFVNNILGDYGKESINLPAN